jgi:UDP-2-acetamido-3-amino-2,3-dideoxy-glucuronate N-acetyltransferase
MKKYFVDKSAIIDKGAKIGTGTKIWHHTHIAKTAIIGKNCSIGQNCYIAGIVGDNCKIQNNVNVYEGVKLGKYVFCGPSMTFTNVLRPRAKYPTNGKYAQTVVEDEVTFGAHVTVVCGIKIGKCAMIGAGAVVTKNIPAFTLAYGNPARIQGKVDSQGEEI